MDYGHKLTDEELKELEKRINAEYTQAEKEVAQKLSNYLAGFMRRDIEQKTLVDAGEISEREYLNWRAGQIATGKRWEELRQSLAEDMHRTNVEAQKQAQSESMDIYALNHNYGTYEVENGAEIDTKYTLYDRQTVERLVKDNPQMLPPPGKKVSERIKAGLDVRWNNQHIQSVMMQSLLQGESIGKIATRLANAVGDSNRAAAIRNARTMTTGAENAGRVDAYERAKEMGVPVRQMWVATIDDRTRESHRKMDGETIEPGETFSNKCRFPGDPLGEPSEVYNCRCTLVARIPGVQYTFAERGTDKASYEEWKKGKETEEKPQVEDVKDETKATGFEFVPAASIADAEEYAKSFVDDSQFGAIGISYKGIGLDVANEVNKTIGDFYNTYNVSQFGGVYAPKGNTKLGKMMQDAHAAYSPVRNSFLINYDCKTLEYVERQLAEEKALVKDFLANPDKYDKSNMSPRALKVLENSVISGRGTVPDNMEDIVNHELGHCLERFIKQADNYDDIMANMEEFAPKISGYAVDNFNEYIAESFCSYKKGEEIVDPELIKAFKELERK